MKEANTPWNVLILVYLLNRVYVLSNGPIDDLLYDNYLGQ